MGFLDWLFFSDVNAYHAVQRSEKNINALKKKIGAIEYNKMFGGQTTQDLQKQNAELKLCLAALIKLLIQKNVMTADELVEFIKIVDMQDGVADGQFTGEKVFEP